MKKYLVVVVLLLIFAILVFTPRLIPINSITCRSQYGPCDSKLVDQFNSFEGKKYFYARKEISKLLSSSKYISEYSIKFNLPDKLNIDLIEKKPSIAFPSSSGKFFLINQFGEVVDEVDETLLPKIYSQNQDPWDFKRGEEVNEELKFAIKIMQKMFYVYNVSDAYVKGDSISFTLSDGRKIIFPLKGDIDVLFGSLQVILSRLQVETNYSIIDLRFKNPVLR